MVGVGVRVGAGVRVGNGGSVGARVAAGRARVTVGTLGRRVKVDTTINGVAVGEGGTVGVDNGVDVVVAGAVGVDSGETNIAVDSGLTGDVGLGATRPPDVAVGNGPMSCVGVSSGLIEIAGVGSRLTQAVKVGPGPGRVAHPASIAPSRAARIARMHRACSFIRPA
jgi:hypothetical protein